MSVMERMRAIKSHEPAGHGLPLPVTVDVRHFELLPTDVGVALDVRCEQTGQPAGTLAGQVERAVAEAVRWAAEEHADDPTLNVGAQHLADAEAERDRLRAEFLRAIAERLPKVLAASAIADRLRQRFGD